jgi:hypothetical protein
MSREGEEAQQQQQQLLQPSQSEASLRLGLSLPALLQLCCHQLQPLVCQSHLLLLLLQELLGLLGTRRPWTLLQVAPESGRCC